MSEFCLYSVTKEPQSSEHYAWEVSTASLLGRLPHDKRGAREITVSHTCILFCIESGGEGERRRRKGAGGRRERAGIEEEHRGGPLRLGWAGSGSTAAGATHIHTHTHTRAHTVRSFCVPPHSAWRVAAVPAPSLLPDIQRYHTFNGNGTGQHRLRRWLCGVGMCDSDSNRDLCIGMLVCVCVCALTMSTLRSL